MIDLMKRLAELDAKNPKVVKENQQVEECGMMPAPSMSAPRTPASIHITADSGSELSAMLRDIATLSGMKHHDDGADSILPGNGSLEIEPLSGNGDLEPTDMDAGPPEPSMRSMIDKLNPSDEKAEETVDSEPNPQTAGQVPGNQDPAGAPGAAQGRNQMNNPVATPMNPSENEVYENLKQEYQRFLTDGKDFDSSEMNQKTEEIYRPDRDAERAWDADERGRDAERSRERNVGVEYDRNNIQVAINGKRWKVFPGKGRADSMEERAHLRKMQQWAERKSAETGKEWKVYLTGASVTNEGKEEINESAEKFKNELRYLAGLK